MVATLEAQYPDYSRASLHDVLAMHAFNLPAALDQLALLEEDQPIQPPPPPPPPPPRLAAPGAVAPLGLDDEVSFPALAGSGSGDAEGAAMETGPGAVLPSMLMGPWGRPDVADTMRRAAKSETAASGNKVPRPEAQARTQAGVPARHGPTDKDADAAAQQVPWVATGAAVSQQYAEARAEARDHMRLRNALFQQVHALHLLCSPGPDLHVHVPAGSSLVASTLLMDGRMLNASQFLHSVVA